jgi:hypothetical protein
MNKDGIPTAAVNMKLKGKHTRRRQKSEKQQEVKRAVTQEEGKPGSKVRRRCFRKTRADGEDCC